jgi:predicted CXXCH cytochrome family protein
VIPGCATFRRLLPLLALLVAMPSARAQTEIARTVHNLTPGGPGQFKETRPTGLCVFCHTPHNAKPSRALWNRDLPPTNYQLYTSSTLQAVVNQPTGSSRLCLSCHDGLLALGALRRPPPGEKLKLGRMTGPKVLGTDLSDDHPVSFVYDSALAVKRGNLVDPASLPAPLKLDASKQMQCTTCHNAHEHRRKKFLRMDNFNGALCLSCHRPPQWSRSTHATSSANWNFTGANPWPADAPNSVAANACRSCHRNHSAGHGPRLLAWPDEPDNCNVCHGATVASKNLAQEFSNGAKYSRHPIESVPWTHDPRENPVSMPRHVACADCHNPHAADASPAVPPLVSGPLKGVSGVSANGSFVAEAAYEYQICIKCHGFGEPNTVGIARLESTRIVRVKIDPNNSSYHPVAAEGKNRTIRGLLPGYTSSSLIDCTACHNNNDWTPTGTAPKGPHASRYAPILERNYVSVDPTPESVSNYDLCYKCHDRGILLNDTGFPHRKHVVEQQAPCAACHDAHGVRQYAHLINFMLRDSSGKTVVSPTRSGRLDYVSSGPGAGSCNLTCHGREHAPLSYPG